MIVNLASEDHDILSLIKFFTPNNRNIKFVKLRVPYLTAKIILKIPVLKNFLSPLLLNHKVKSNLKKKNNF